MLFTKAGAVQPVSWYRPLYCLLLNEMRPVLWRVDQCIQFTIKCLASVQRQERLSDMISVK